MIGWVDMLISHYNWCFNDRLTQHAQQYIQFPTLYKGRVRVGVKNICARGLLSNTLGVRAKNLKLRRLGFAKPQPNLQLSLTPTVLVYYRALHLDGVHPSLTLSACA
jgi:hypothetical protein